MTDETSTPFFIALAVLTLCGVLFAVAAHAGDEPSASSRFICADQNDTCRERIIVQPDGRPGQVLKFEICKQGDCDREHREHWATHYIVPPPGNVCQNSDVDQALAWIEQHRKGWLLAGWGCVSTRRIAV